MQGVKRVFLRSISLLLVFVLTLSCLSVPASAAVDPGALSDILGIADWAVANSFKGAVWLQSMLWPEQICNDSPNHRHDFQRQNTNISGEYGTFYVCKYCERPAPDVFDEAYGDYTQDVKDKTGTTTLIDGGIRVYFKPSDKSLQYITDSGSYIGDTYFFYNGSGDQYWNETTKGCNLKVYFNNPITIPFAAFCSTGYSVSGVNWGVEPLSGATLYTNISKSAGSTLYAMDALENKWRFVKVNFLYQQVNSGYVVAYADLKPISGVLGDYYDIDISNSTRPTVISGDVGYYDSSNNLQVIQNTTIVNETNKTFFNPVTNLTTNIVNWSYDYSDRSYSLTLDTGDKVLVTYGSENITIIEGGNTYNVYYTVPKDTPTDPTDPTDPETAGFFAWWKAAWADFRTWLAGVLPGGDSPSVPDGTLPDLPGATEEDEGFSILDIIVKIVSALWRLISGFFGTIFGGVLQFFTSLGEGIDGFFSAFEGDSGVFGFGKYGGADIWD